jgi:hypothetical protein
MTDPLIKSLEVLTAHRPYQGASPLWAKGFLGFELGAEAVLVKMPNSLISALGGGSSSLTILPAAKIHVAQGIGPWADVSVSGLWYNGTGLIGGGLKILLWKPEEGPVLAARVGYNYTNFDIARLGLFQISLTGADASNTSFALRTHTITPQFVLSKRMSFAEPYLVAGLVLGTGWVAFSTTLSNAQAGVSQTVTTQSTPVTSLGFEAITGIIFRVPLLKMKIALEGGYSSLGMPNLGAQFGFAF